MHPLREKVKTWPNVPGIYQFLSKGRIVYIGKSKHLKNRVLSYFRGKHERQKLFVMMEFIDDVKYIPTDTHLEACLLELTRIRQLQPMYNAQYKREKQALYLTDHPTKLLTMSPSGTWGPFFSRRTLENTIGALQSIVPIRYNGSFEWEISPIRRRLQREEQEETHKAIRSVFEDPEMMEQFIQSIEAKMLEAASQLMFERAQWYKRLIQNLRRIGAVLTDKKKFMEHSWVFEQDGYLLYVAQGEILCKSKKDEAEAFYQRIENMNISLPPPNYERAAIVYQEVRKNQGKLQRKVRNFDE